MRRSQSSLRPYISTTVPELSDTGTTTQPLKCSWPRGPEDPEAVQAAPQLGALLALLGGQAVGQGAVGVAEAEHLDRLGVVDSPGTEVSQRLGGAEEGGVVVLDHLGQGLGVAGVVPDRGSQAAHRASGAGARPGRAAGRLCRPAAARRRGGS